ncbi:hypothetical protein Sste5346_006209 [Sporothrix stenoceras]|uniref:Uncharacterized protein n=1 Tax=Sporothrix stenoceras TaxID=5173 RepID=A0ABR3YZ83_9PEZI
MEGRVLKTRARVVSSEDEEEQHPPKRARLARRNLARLEKSTSTAASTIQASKDVFLRPGKSKPPSNLEEIRQRLDQPHDTPSPPESRYELYVEAVEAAETEATIVSQVERLLKHPETKGYRLVLNQAFLAYPEDAGFNEGLESPQPNIVEGLSLNEYRWFPVRHA